MGARLVDAQAPGLARRVRALPGLLAGGGGTADEQTVLALGRLVLSVRGRRRQDAPDDALRAELRAAVGFAPGAEEVAVLPGVEEHWTVLAQTVEDEEALRVQATWLAAAGGRVAQVLDLSAGERSLPLAPGPGHASIQLGGGTDIDRAVGYCEGPVERPDDTILVLISDLYEGGMAEGSLARAHRPVSSGVRFIALSALSDEGAPSYDRQLAGRLAALGVPGFARTPDLFPDLMAAAIRKEDVGRRASGGGGARAV